MLRCIQTKHKRKLDKKLHPPFTHKGNLRITKNFRGIALTDITAKVYNALLLNLIRPEVEKTLEKNWNGFQRNRFTISRIHRIIEKVRAKNLEAILPFADFSLAFNSIHRGQMEQILLAYNPPKETVSTIMVLYKNMEAMVYLPDDETDFFNTVAGVLQKDT